MLSRHKKLRAFVATLGLIGSMFVLQATIPSAAQARCNGVGNEIVSTLVVNGSTYVSEDPLNGTCQNNDYYQSDFHSHFGGWRASVWILHNGVWDGTYGAYNTDWVHLNFSDTNSTSSMHFCLDNGDVWYCGWGTNYAYTDHVTHFFYGNNNGY